MAVPSRRRLPPPGQRTSARFLGVLLIVFSPLPLLLMFMSWGSDVFAGKIVPKELNVIGALYGLLGASAITLGVVMNGRYYRGYDAVDRGRPADQRLDDRLPDVEIKRTSMSPEPVEGKGPEEELARVRRELAALRVRFGLRELDAAKFATLSLPLVTREKELEAVLRPEPATVQRIPDHNRASKRP